MRAVLPMFCNICKFDLLCRRTPVLMRSVFIQTVVAIFEICTYVRLGSLGRYDPVVGSDSERHGADGSGAEKQRHLGDCVSGTSHCQGYCLLTIS